MKSSTFHRTTVVVACASLLGACSALIDADKVNYKTESTAKTVPLDIPPDLTQLTRDSRFAVPGGGTVTASSLNGRAAQPAVATTAPKQVNDVRIERDGKQRWLVVNRPAEIVWPIIHQFWKDNGFEYVVDQQSLGLLETEWAENRAKIPQDFIRRSLGKVIDGLYSSGERDKFRTRMERNSHGGVDIYITHRGMSEEFRDQSKIGTMWVARPNDPELEAEFLSRLMIKLGVSAQEANPAVATTQASTSRRASLVTQSGHTVLTLSDSFDVSWRRLGVSLDRTGFTVEDRDRAQGIYFVRYVDTSTQEEKGFFGKLFSSSANTTGPVKYRIAIKTMGNASEVAVLNADGKLENSPVTQKMLKILADDLR